MLLKHRAHYQAVGIEQVDKGIDFMFSCRSHAARLADFLKTVVPIQTRQSKTLVSHDTHSNIYNYKYSFSVEIVPICREDLLVLPPVHNKGGIGPVVVCYRVTKNLSLINPFTLQTCDIIN